MERTAWIGLWQRQAAIAHATFKRIWKRGWALLGKLLRPCLHFLVDLLQWAYDRLEKPVKRRVEGFFEKVEQGALYWQSRGWPPIVYCVGVQLLLLIPVNVVVYAFEAALHLIPLQPFFLLAWMLFASAIEARMLWVKACREGDRGFMWEDLTRAKPEKREGAEDGDNGGAAEHGGGAV
jgi:hypothetical protein